ncbi:hypothetical protein OF377_00915 [Ureaplasma sp. ES3154-GEN]|uniref:hypothetical protein n=1 Tax=Ureaplasma sp. ES3154-GEN TaxID=2984844 RepID=UPI0021E7E8A6|nr:hypothetical protein [Ureaplasma sp. ES3154-GEN]MCV3743449.1 hypothetical protein [Ureaplasma sp. ES3154-GEN]
MRKYKWWWFIISFIPISTVSFLAVACAQLNQKTVVQKPKTIFLTNELNDLSILEKEQELIKKELEQNLTNIDFKYDLNEGWVFSVKFKNPSLFQTFSITFENQETKQKHTYKSVRFQDVYKLNMHLNNDLYLMKSISYFDKHSELIHRVNITQPLGFQRKNLNVLINVSVADEAKMLYHIDSNTWRIPINLHIDFSKQLYWKTKEVVLKIRDENNVVYTSNPLLLKDSNLHNAHFSFINLLPRKQYLIDKLEIKNVPNTFHNLVRVHFNKQYIDTAALIQHFSITKGLIKYQSSTQKAQLLLLFNGLKNKYVQLVFYKHFKNQTTNAIHQQYVGKIDLNGHLQIEFPYDENADYELNNILVFDDTDAIIYVLDNQKMFKKMEVRTNI